MPPAAFLAITNFFFQLLVNLYEWIYGSIFQGYVFTLFSVGVLDGWMTCSFMPFTTVFQSYQENGLVIHIYERLSATINLNPVCGRKDPSLKLGSQLGLLDQQSSTLPTELPGLLHVL